MDTLFSHVSVVTMDERMSVWPDAFVGVTDGKISWLSGKAPEEKPAQIINGEGLLLMPGLVNAHTHLAMNLMRGWADDLSLRDWLQYRVFPREEKLDARAVKAAVTLAVAEAVRFGTTSVSDMYQFTDETASVIAESGLKANLCRGPVWFENPDEDFDFEREPACQELVALTEKWHGYDHGRIKIDASIHSEYTSAHPFWEATARFAQEKGLRMQLHLSQTQAEEEDCAERYGLSQTQILDCHHIFDVPAAAAHCVHLSAEDMRLLGRRKASAVHCPVSELKLVSGCADVAGMVKAGMNVCLGTDSAASNNSLDLFEEMKAAALLSRARAQDPAALPAEAVLMMATVCGAKAQGREAECGMIKPGMDADLILLDLSQPHMIPCHNILSNLVYAANGRDVLLTMVRGKILYFAGKYPTLDVDGALRELRDYAIPTVFAEDRNREEEAVQ